MNDGDTCWVMENSTSTTRDMLEGGLGTLALIAAPGIGNSSALVDLGREHYVIYIQSSTKSNITGFGAMNQQSREFDHIL